MAIKGLAVPVFADYNFDGNVVRYTNGFVCGSVIEYGAEIETTDNNPLYGDNRVIENDYGKFNGGTLTLNTSTPKGFGIIEEHQIDDVDKYRGVILCKVSMNIPAEAATTRGERIDWQTKEIEGAISRSDENTANYKHPWKREAWFDSEEEAMEYI